MKLGMDTLKRVVYNLLKKVFRFIPCMERIQGRIQRVLLKLKQYWEAFFFTKFRSDLWVSGLENRTNG